MRKITRSFGPFQSLGDWAGQIGIFQQLSLEIKIVFLNGIMGPICQLIESLFAFISKIDRLGVLKAETRSYLFNTRHQKSAHFTV